jgi:hypothetical protein
MVHASLKASGALIVQGKMEGAFKFIEWSTVLGFPANIFVILDMHTKMDTDSLQYGRGKTNPMFAQASEVVSKYCSETLLKVTKAVNICRKTQGPTKIQYGSMTQPIFAEVGEHSFL